MPNPQPEKVTTIVAPATPVARSAIAVIRLSGPRTRDVAGAVAPLLGERPLEPRRSSLVRLLDRAGRPIDLGLLTFFPGPESYSGEDMAEISSHGSPAIVDALLDACIQNGAQPARPGEFTLRAVRNGKLDLAQAEAVEDLVGALTTEQAVLAERQLRGEVGQALLPLAEQVAELAAEAEAVLDFPEDDSPLPSPGPRLSAGCSELIGAIDRLDRASSSARRLRDGARVVLLGPPNSGKSSLFNALCGRERVIVSEEPGTTRDLVEETLDLSGMPVVLVDAAGVGKARGQADALGMDRALGAARGADLVLRLYDASRQASPAPDPALPLTLVVGTHADLIPKGGKTPEGGLLVSPVTGEGLEGLREELARCLRIPGRQPVESVALASQRHLGLARRARAHLERARELAGSDSDYELAATELRATLSCLEEILGFIHPDDLLDRVFARFCIGK